MCVCVCVYMCMCACVCACVCLCIHDLDIDGHIIKLSNTVSFDLIYITSKIHPVVYRR